MHFLSNYFTIYQLILNEDSIILENKISDNPIKYKSKFNY